jgi:hypothetical protein
VTESIMLIVAGLAFGALSWQARADLPEIRQRKAEGAHADYLREMWEWRTYMFAYVMLPVTCLMVAGGLVKLVIALVG